MNSWTYIAVVFSTLSIFYLKITFASNIFCDFTNSKQPLIVNVLLCFHRRIFISGYMQTPYKYLKQKTESYKKGPYSKEHGMQIENVVFLSTSRKFKICILNIVSTAYFIFQDRIAVVWFALESDPGILQVPAPVWFVLLHVYLEKTYQCACSFRQKPQS